MAETSRQVSLPDSNEELQILETALQALLDILIKGKISNDLDKNIKENIKFKALSTHLEELAQYTLAISTGDLSRKLAMKGVLAGSLKNLQSSLIHLTWQTKMISQGDFEQRVDFMGDFSASFNDMVEKLKNARIKIQQREAELLNANNNLVREIGERKRVEEILRDTNESLQTHIEEIELLQNQLREQAIHDALTGLFNRGYLQETLEREITRAQRASKPVAIIMMDIDKFKLVNDTFGHKAGDIMLQELGKLLRSISRSDDIACRYGGEEFVIVMPGASLQIAQERAETIRKSFDAIQIDYEENRLHATISLGIAVFPTHGSDGDTVLNHADQALYQAKHTGRNRVILYTKT